MDISISWFFQVSASDRVLQEAIKICAIGFLTLQSQTAFSGIFFENYTSDRGAKMMNLIKYVLNSWLVDGNRETDLEDIYGTLHRSRVYFPYDIRVRSQSNFLANINRPYPNNNFSLSRELIIDNQHQTTVPVKIRSTTKSPTTAQKFKVSDECISNESDFGAGYRGMSITKRGVTCIRWDSLTTWNKFHPNNPAMKSKDLRENFCRNPDGDERGPWCFVSIQPRKFQYCSIPLCQGGVAFDVAKSGQNASTTRASTKTRSRLFTTKRTTTSRMTTKLTTKITTTSTTTTTTTTSTTKSTRQKWAPKPASNYSRWAVMRPTARKTTTATSEKSTTTSTTTSSTSTSTTTTTTRSTTKSFTEEYKTSWLNNQEHVTDEPAAEGPKNDNDCYEYYFYDDDGETLSVDDCLKLLE